MSIRQVSNMLATWAAIIGAVATAYAFVHSYRESVSKQVDDRRRQSFELLRQFTSRDFLPIREKALQFMRAAERCEPRSTRDGQPNETEAFTFVEFFDLVHACADAGLCDEALLRQFFVPYANGHWLAFKPMIEQVRVSEARLFKVEKPFGIGLEKLGGEMRAFPGCPPPR